MLQDSYQLFISVLAISILHAILPNHWLPVVAIARQLRWSNARTLVVTLLAALAHSLSTVIIGIVVAVGGMKLGEYLPYFRFAAAAILIALGIFFIWRHQHHKHFHMRAVSVQTDSSMSFILGSILLAMFLSPCLEVGALFLVAGAESMTITLLMATVYTITSAIGMMTFAWLALMGLKQKDWHRIEHNSGLISGLILIATGIMFIFIQ